MHDIRLLCIISVLQSLCLKSQNVFSGPSFKQFTAIGEPTLRNSRDTYDDFSLLRFCDSFCGHTDIHEGICE